MKQTGPRGAATAGDSRGTACLRLTPQRRAVLLALRDSADHPTAADLYARVRQRLPGIGAATVYRALHLLVEAGLAVELSIGDKAAARYDGNLERHDHLVCVGCGRVVDVALPPPDLSGIAETGFAVLGYDLRIHGVCPGCRATTGSAPR